MPFRTVIHLVLLLLIPVAAAQIVNPHPPASVPENDKPIRLPDGKLQSEEIMKADHVKAAEDAKALLDLAQSLQKDLTQEGSVQVLSLADIHKTEEIEKLAKRIRTRIRQW